MTTDDEGYELTPEKRLGKFVRELREARGWSQAELADRLSAEGLDMTQVLVSRIEQNKRPVRFDEAVVISHVLGFAVGDVATRSIRLDDPRRAEGVAWVAFNRAVGSMADSLRAYRRAYDALGDAIAEAERARATWKQAADTLGDAAPRRVDDSTEAFVEAEREHELRQLAEEAMAEQYGSIDTGEAGA